MSQNALIFSPRFDGHREVYIFVIANVLKELGFNIFIAGNAQQKVYNSFYIDKLKEKSEASFIDTSKYQKGGLDISIVEFLQIQDLVKADLTIFTEADFHLNLLASQIGQKKNKLKGRTVGIFMQPFYYYEEGLGFIDKLKYLKHAPSRIKRDKRLFYEFFLKRFSLLDVSLCIDENFVNHHQYINWLPDVFQQYAELIIKDERPAERKWIENLERFKERNKGRFHFLYFGTSQYRRGYDILLKLAEKKDGTFIHCGLIDQNAKYDYDTEQVRMALDEKGCLFETQAYLTDPLSIEYFLKAASHMVLPYRRYYGSSGVMLQGLSLEIPVLSPDHGVIGQRIENHNLGMTCTGHQINFLEPAYDTFNKTNPALFKKSINAYMNFQTIGQLKNVLINSFTGANRVVKQPS